MEGEKKGRPLIREIAESAGVSVGTVSIVLNGRGDAMRISKPTQQRVLEAAKAVNYQPNIYARRLRDAGTSGGRVVAVFWGDSIIDVAMGNFFHGLHQTTKAQHHDTEFYVQIFDTGTLHKFKNAMTPTRFSGIIVCGAGDEDMAFLENNDFGLPVVVTDRNSPRFHCVHGNNYEIGRNIAQLFARRGHKRVAMVSLKHRLYGASLRQLGYVENCGPNGLELRPEWVQEGDARDYDSGYSSTRAMLQGAEHPTAIFVTSPGQALGTVIACRDTGLRVPEDVEVICYGNNSLFEYFTPSISTVHTSLEAMAESALSLLMLVLENSIDMPMSRLLYGEYHFRQSCGGFPDDDNRAAGGQHPAGPAAGKKEE